MLASWFRGTGREMNDRVDTIMEGMRKKRRVGCMVEKRMKEAWRA